MAQRAIREYDGKRLLSNNWPEYFGENTSYQGNFVLVNPETDLNGLPKRHKWLNEMRLVVKPDQLFSKRKKHNLIKVNASYNEVKAWIREHMCTNRKACGVRGLITHFLIEPFVPHDDEHYISIVSIRTGDRVNFSAKGGVDIESAWNTVTGIDVGILDGIEDADIENTLLKNLENGRQPIANFIRGLFKFYRDFGFTYLEINPFVSRGDSIVPLDMVARIDDTAHFDNGSKWGNITFPAPFGRELSKEEKFILDLDKKSGASMKLTVFNPEGRIWLMTAGGGGSVVYTDTIIDLGGKDELANYGEYGGNPTTDETYLYSKTILNMMTKNKLSGGRAKILIVGGAIANFTDVAKTFTGIAKAVRELQKKLRDANVKILVRRGGPNHAEGIRLMKELGNECGIHVEAYGPETHMTRIVDKAMKYLE